VSKKSARQTFGHGPAISGLDARGTKLRLDDDGKGADLPDSSPRGFIMSRECSITGAKPAKGHVIHRRGMAKKKGGVGQHVTANTSRLFTPNLKTKRIWVPELSRFVTVKLSARALKTISKNGAFKTLKKAGLV
jgi:large subunit ribosomal protein L28